METECTADLKKKLLRKRAFNFFQMHINENTMQRLSLFQQNKDLKYSQQTHCVNAVKIK